MAVYNSKQGMLERERCKTLGEVARKTVWTDKELVEMLYQLDRMIGYQDGYTDSPYDLVAYALVVQHHNLLTCARNRGIVE